MSIKKLLKNLINKLKMIYRFMISNFYPKIINIIYIKLFATLIGIIILICYHLNNLMSNKSIILFQLCLMLLVHILILILLSHSIWLVLIITILPMIINPQLNLNHIHSLMDCYLIRNEINQLKS